MFVFEAMDTGTLVLLDVTTKAQLPFDEYVVVAGRVQCCRQLTCVGGRVKRDGKRRLLVVPLLQAQESKIPSVQVLDVGEVAVNFLQGRRKSEEKEGLKKQKHKAKTLHDVKTQQLKTEALNYMDQIKVKMLTTLDDLFCAFQIADPTNVQSLLQYDPSMPKHYQLLCMDCPPFDTADDTAHVDVPHGFSSSAPPEPFNFGVLFLEVATNKVDEHYLHIPVPRSPLSGMQGEVYNVQESFQDATVLTFGTKREESAHGGGKTCDEMIKNIRMRHASGTFCTLVLPTKTWEQVVDKHKTFFPQICELQGKLRLRRFMGTTPCGTPVEVLLE
ncbi:unnamed protein product [Peronospora belbahrii]|uniref:Uncharacterized protein n=1 Tax=Peronospora belbahrii TaxID=622444 RepID=A0AAU9KU59_9STRA|nr:unnamed protein product [Peronospora belbahrii]